MECECDSDARQCRNLASRLVNVAMPADQQIAISELIDRFGGMAIYSIRRFLADRSLADDTFQEIIIEWLTQVHRWDPHASGLCRWLATATSRVVARQNHQIRRSKKEASVSSEENLRSGNEWAGGLDKTDLERCMRKVLPDWPARKWDALRWRVQRVPVIEIARRLGVDRRTVNEWAKQTKTVLRRCLEQRIRTEPASVRDR